MLMLSAPATAICSGILRPVSLNALMTPTAMLSLAQTTVSSSSLPCIQRSLSNFLAASSSKSVSRKLSAGKEMFALRNVYLNPL